jgi:hypothetical protein
MGEKRDDSWGVVRGMVLAFQSATKRNVTPSRDSAERLSAGPFHTSTLKPHARLATDPTQRKNLSRLPIRFIKQTQLLAKLHRSEHFKGTATIQRRHWSDT